MNKKQKSISEKEQKVAAGILTEYVIVHNDKGFNGEFFERIMHEYELMKDPFTFLPCTSKEYEKNSLEYDRQTMIEKYGHCDGLD